MMLKMRRFCFEADGGDGADVDEVHDAELDDGGFIAGMFG